MSCLAIAVLLVLYSCTGSTGESISDFTPPACSLELVRPASLVGDVVTVRMTLTTPACPAAESLPPEVEAKVRAIEEVTDAKVELVWDPPWRPDRMSEAARLEAGLM